MIHVLQSVTVPNHDGCATAYYNIILCNMYIVYTRTEFNNSFRIDENLRIDVYIIMYVYNTSFLNLTGLRYP